MNIRVGFGYDVHQLREGHDFWIGGLLIPAEKGAFGHSDADVLIHAICDALLGAANMRDIGFHFPDTSDEFDGIDSKKLLARVVELIGEKGYSVVNVDSTVVLEKPKLSQHIPAMQKTMASVMGIDPDAVAVKATTNEKLGFVGREEGVAAHAVCLIQKA